MVRYPEPERQSLASLEDIRTPDDRLVPLLVAEVEWDWLHG